MRNPAEVVTCDGHGCDSFAIVSVNVCPNGWTAVGVEGSTQPIYLCPDCTPPSDTPVPADGHAVKDGVVLWCGEWEAYWRPGGKGYTDEIGQAGVYTRSEAERICAGLGPDKKMEIRPAPVPAETEVDDG